MISKNLKYLRKEHGLSQEEFAEKLNVSRQTVAKWENGDNLPDIENCKMIASYFDTTIDNLVYYSFEEQDMLGQGVDGKYIFGIAKVGEKGQIVIPKSAREVFDINPGDRLVALGDTKKGGIAFAKLPVFDMFSDK